VLLSDVALQGEFRSWLVCVLVDEALLLLRESVPTSTPKVLCEPVPARVFRSNDVCDGKRDIRNDDQERFSRDFSMTRNTAQNRLLEEGGKLK
jgi:hypothetical protein